MKKLVIIKSYKDGDNEIAIDTEIEVSAEMAVELIEKGFAKEIEVKVEAVEDTKLSDLEDEVKELKSKLENLDKKDKGDNKIMNIEVKEQNMSPEMKFLQATKLAKFIKTGVGDAETKVIAGASESVTADGGALLDKDVIGGIEKVVLEKSELFNLARKRPVGKNFNSIELKAFDEPLGTPADYIGVNIVAVGEGAAMSYQKRAVKVLSAPVKKFGWLAAFTSEIIEDDAHGILMAAQEDFGTALSLVLDNEMLYGSLSNFTAAVGAAGSRAVTLADASTPTVAELMSMYSSQINKKSAEWYMSPAVHSNILQLEDTAGNPVMVQNYAVSPYGTIMGRPVNVVNCMLGANGEAGTIGFCDWSEGYIIGTKGNVRMESSVHILFDTDQEAYRFIYRAAGMPTKARTLTLKGGTILSPLVFGTDS